jgi:phytanoyl-CoA hydroxylase
MGAKTIVLSGRIDPRGKRIVEAHGTVPEARAPFLSDQMIEFLHGVLDQTPVLTQTLIFHTGSEQDLHQDTAFVVYDDPMKLVAAWVALEDVQPGSGELTYLVGSHRLPDFPFSSGDKNAKRVPPEEVKQYLAWLLEEGRRRGFETRTFRSKKGDILLWHADLVHGGAPLKDPTLTRKSLVGHFCPESVKPRYYGGHAYPRRWCDGPLLYSSYLYDVENGVPY